VIIIHFPECFGLYTWKIIPRMTDWGVTEVPAQAMPTGSTQVTITSCALQCEFRRTCKLFRINKVTSECDLYDGEHYKTAKLVAGNQFYQKVPDSASKAILLLRYLLPFILSDIFRQNSFYSTGKYSNNGKQP
jgi:hypothetical protein